MTLANPFGRLVNLKKKNQKKKIKTGQSLKKIYIKKKSF